MGQVYPDTNFMGVSPDGSRIYVAQGVVQPDADVNHLRIGAIR